LVAARRGATLRAKMAGRETSKRRTFGRKRKTKHEGRNGVKGLGGGRPRYLRKQDLQKLQLESTGNLNATFGKTTRREIAKRIVRSTVGSQTINIWTLWRGRGSTSSEAEKGAARRAGAGDVEAPAYPTGDDDVNLNRREVYYGAARDEHPSRRRR
jgi:hypothetical protein